MKHIAGLFFTAFLLIGTGVGAQGATLVTNGSFEQGTLGIGSFAGWQTNLGDTSTFVDSNGQTGTRYGQAYDGLWAAYFGSTAADGGASLSQTLATSVGQEYLLTFALANDNGGLTPVNNFQVTVGNTTAFSFTNLPNQNYLVYQFAFAGSGSQTPLTFFASNDNSYFALDNVAVSAVPEPAALSFAGIGAALVILGLYRRSGRQ